MQKLDYVTKKIRGRKILVIGDMVADVYVDGRISRISREAPVLVLEEAGEKVVAGGAANVVNNVASMGGEVFAVGVLGDDKNAEGLRKILGDNGVHLEGLVMDKTRPTISKTRIIAGGRATVSQQIVRIDKESKEPLSKKMEAALISKLDKLMPQVDGIILSDYGAGTITESVRKLVIRYCGQNKVPSMVDSRYNVGSFAGIGFVKQNDSELASFVGHSVNDMTSLIAAGTSLLSKLNANGVLITRGELGMSLFERGGAVHHIPVTDKSEVFDVSGAGDTCVAAFMLSIAAGLTAPVAARVSNYASGIAVRKMGTATVNIVELGNVLEKAK